MCRRLNEQEEVINDRHTDDDGEAKSKDHWMKHSFEKLFDRNQELSEFIRDQKKNLHKSRNYNITKC